MDITFSCQTCGQHIVIDEAGAGQTIQCPKCGNNITVPSLASETVAPSLPPIHDAKTCPSCAETVKLAAKVCRFCGYDFVTGQRSTSPASQTVQQPVESVRARSGVMDGVKLGCGMFIVLPLIILGIIAFAFHGCGSTVSGFVNARKQSQARRIINDARQLDSAIDMWAIAKGHKDSNAVNTVEAAVYLKGQAWMSNDILNNPYSFGNVGTNQVTISSETKTALDGVGVDWGNF